MPPWSSEDKALHHFAQLCCMDAFPVIFIGLWSVIESIRDDEKQSNYLKETTESDREIELLAIVDGKVVGMAGFNAIGSKYKVRHRAEFGITVSKNYWGQGIGKAIMNACIECAKEAGYIQLELDVVADNTRAIELYKKLGFIEFGRNPKGFQSKYSGFQELVYMRLEL